MTTPTRSSRTAYSPIDERAGRQDYDAQRTSGNTNDLRGKVIRIHPEDDGTYTVPAGNLFAPGTEKTRPEIYAMGFRNPFRIGTDPKTNTLYVGDYGPDANADNPNRGPRGLWSSGTSSRPGNYGWPYCTGTNEAYNDYTFPSGPSGAKFDCAAPVNNSPNNTGLTNLPPVVPATVDYGYAGDARYPEIGGGGAPMGGPVYRYDADVNSNRKWPAYYDGKALLGEWNQNKMYTMQVTPDGKSLVDINQLLTGMSMIRPMDFEFGPDGALYLIEWGSGFGGNNDNSGVYRIDYTAGDRAPIAAAVRQPDLGSGAADCHLLQRRLPGPGRWHAHLRVDVRRRADLHRGQPDPHVRRRRATSPPSSPSPTPRVVRRWPTCRSPWATPPRRSPSSSRRTAGSSTGATRSDTPSR